jgi:uncharacterized protein (TIGR03066 family)
VKVPSRSAGQPKESPTPAAAGGRQLPPWPKSLLLGFVCAALSAGITFAAFEIFLPAPLPAALLGKWVVVEGEELKGATLEFFPDGSMVGTVQIEGREVAVKGRAQVEGNLFRVTTSSLGGRTTDSQEILELNDRRFAVQDSRGELLILERRSAARAPAPGGMR